MSVVAKRGLFVSLLRRRGDTMRLYRTTCALSSDDGLCVEMGVSGGGRVAVAVGQRPSVRLNRITRTSKEPPFRTTQTVMGLF